MTRYHTSGRCAWTSPRSPANDAWRAHVHGPIEPMDEPPTRVPLWVSLTLIVATIAITLWSVA